MELATASAALRGDFAAPPAAAAAGTKARRTFRVRLDGASSVEVDFKELVHASEAANASSRYAPATGDAEGPAPQSESRAPLDREEPTNGRSQRFSIIERLEKRYGSGAVLHLDDDDAAPAREKKRANRRDDDDLYDLDDPFIDDAELQQNIEEVHTLAKVKTKHSGFFVNAGDEIETLARDDSDDEDARPSKGRRGKKGESSRAFLDEWSDAASDWQPGPEVVQGLEVLRDEVRELEATAPITKVFPRTLDDALRAVDKLVVDSHPNKWRVNGYFATLMTFLPFTKQYLKSNMLRLEARDAARSAKERIESSVQAIEHAIEIYNKRVESETPERVKEDVLKDKSLGSDLHALLGIHDEWVAKENEYRQMLKTEDKKHMKEPDYVQLNARQERNRVFNRVLGLFSANLMDVQSLRALNKSAKVKAPRKAPTKPTSKPTSASSSPAAKRKSAGGASDTSSASVKRATKPFKSRMMDEAPVFNERDFEEDE